MSKQMTMGVLVGNRGFFPSHLATWAASKSSPRWKPPASSPSASMPEATATARSRPTRTRSAAPRCLNTMPPPSTASSSLCRTLARSAAWPTPCVWPICASPSWSRPRRMRPPRCPSPFAATVSAARCPFVQPPPVRHPLAAHPLHTVSPDSPEFAYDLDWFAAVCRVVKGLRNLRIGSIGARPAAFNTVRYCEKFLERSGITVETIDLSESSARSRAWDADDTAQPKLAEIRSMSPSATRPKPPSSNGQAGAVMDAWMKAYALDVSAVQCWTCSRSSSASFLHRHVHDEREPSRLGLRGRCPGHALHARPHAGQPDAVCPARLEQQLQPTPTKPSASTAPTCPSTSSTTA